MYCTRCGAWAPDEQAVCATCQAPLGGAMPHTTPAAPDSAAPATPAPGELPRSAYGGFWRRFWGSMIDALLLWFPDALLRVGMGLPLFDSGEVSFLDPRIWQIGGIMFVVHWLYACGLMASPLQGTLGQRLLGLRVATLAGARISFARANGRFFASLLSGLTLLLGYLANVWTRRRQTLHDWIAGTVVLRDPAPTP